MGLDLTVVDSSGNEVPPDGQTQGEVLIRGPWITSCYYNAPGSETQFTQDGYWRSGDVGTIDAEGYVKITDRVKDVIKSGGEWISSVDMENEIVSHPGVLEAAVVGVATSQMAGASSGPRSPASGEPGRSRCRRDPEPSEQEIRQVAAS